MTPRELRRLIEKTERERDWRPPFGARIHEPFWKRASVVVVAGIVCGGLLMLLIAVVFALVSAFSGIVR